MHIQPFYDPTTATVSYVVSDSTTQRCAIIDAVYDYDPAAGRLSTESANKIIDYVHANQLQVEWILETHIHADHLTAARYLKQQLGGKIGIGSQISAVINYWVPIFNTAQDTPADGSQFDCLFADGATFQIGSLTAKVLHTPGHTPACVSYLVQDAVFVGDAMFMPYVGTGRADFPGGSAETLYQSLQKILALPASTRIYTGHDYPPQGEAATWESTVAEQKDKNAMVNDKISEQEFIAARKLRDSKLPVPRLLLPALQFNLRGGSLGDAEDNQSHYLKIPINVL